MMPHDECRIACRLDAIASECRPRYSELIGRLCRSIVERREQANGYRYRLNASGIGPAEIGEWMALERLCCPFLEIELSVNGRDDHRHLTITGPDGVKPVLDAVFPDVTPSAR